MRLEPTSLESNRFDVERMFVETSKLVAKLRLEMRWLEEVGSTNTYLREQWPETNEKDTLQFGKLVMTAKQTSGRGRQGRAWETPKGLALAMSYLTEDFSKSKLGPGWVPLLAGSAAAAAVQAVLPLDKTAKVKWPNDVQVVHKDSSNQDAFGKKVCGILCEMMTDGSVIIGAGFNLFIAREDLPTPRAASLLSLGAETGGAQNIYSIDGAKFADRIAARFIEEIVALAVLARENPERARERVLSDSHTIGMRVRAELPGGLEIVGVAESFADDGSLVICDQTGNSRVVSAGDVWHLRPAEL
ncbi:MAG TPA: biotin--[acetyl-CoA-carboxylase] ligase [Microbacteriaceae bacterium]|nr:biotin--[acetyl-CoA-carboxylase] ligase [Microbacteriaceae bacterium]